MLTCGVATVHIELLTVAGLLKLIQVYSCTMCLHSQAEANELLLLDEASSLCHSYGIVALRTTKVFLGWSFGTSTFDLQCAFQMVAYKLL